MYRASERHEDQRSEPQSGKQRKRYRRPRLIEYGAIQELTHGGGGALWDAGTGAFTLQPTL